MAGPCVSSCFFFQAEDGIRDLTVTGVQTCALPICIDLQNGVLRARLQGNRLDLTELRMQGGRGSNARILGYSGNLTTAPREGGELTGSGFVRWDPDRKSTRLNSSHSQISYAVFCLKKKKERK